MLSVKKLRRRGNLDKGEEAEGSFESFPAIFHKGREGGISKPHLLKPKRLGGFWR